MQIDVVGEVVADSQEIEGAEGEEVGAEGEEVAAEGEEFALLDETGFEHQFAAVGEGPCGGGEGCSAGVAECCVGEEGDAGEVGGVGEEGSAEEEGCAAEGKGSAAGLVVVEGGVEEDVAE